MTINETNNLPRFSSSDILAKYDNDSKISSFLDQVFLFNQKVNIVSRETSREKLTRIAADCLVPLELGINISGKLFDIGPGGGFPAIILLLALPGTDGVLIERTGKKAEFLKKMKDKFDLTASVINQNFVEAVSQLDSGSFDIGLMKYVRLERQILASAISLLKPNGMFIYYSQFDKSNIPDKGDISTVQHCYYLDDIEQVRTITIFLKKV